MKMYTRLLLLLLAAVMALGCLPVSPVSAQTDDTGVSPENRVLTESDYASAEDIFARIDAAESAPAKKGVDQVDAAIAIVTSSESYVEGSLERNGDTFTWWTEDGIRCVYSPRMRELEKNMTPETGEDLIVNEPKATKSGMPTGTQVYLVGPYYGYDSNFKDQYKEAAARAAAYLNDADGYTLYSGKDATVDKVAQAVSNGAVVFFDSHGSTDYENPDDANDLVTGATSSYLCLTSTTGLTYQDYADGALYYDTGVWINGETIANHMTKKSPSGFLWMAMCLGMATDTLCAPLRNMGVEVVYGYSQSVTFGGEYRFQAAFWQRIFEGKTVAEAAAYMKERYGCWDWSKQIANSYSDYSYYATLAAAQAGYTSFPIVVSDEDPYPGRRTATDYGVDDLQTVLSGYKLTDYPLMGLCGSAVAWRLQDGKLTINGTGATSTYGSASTVPWNAYAESIHTVEVKEGVTVLGNYLFDGCKNLTSVSLPSTLTSIYSYAFRDCDSLTSFTFPSNLTSIGQKAFSDCDGLTSVIIPASITNVGSGAFADCRNLTAIWVDSKNTQYCSDAQGVLYSKDKTVLVEYPSGRSGGYSILDGTATIEYDAFQGCPGLTELTIPTSVSKINYYSFDDCPALTDVYYKGDRNQWESIDRNPNNEALEQATFHYNGSSLWVKKQPTNVAVMQNQTAVFTLTAEGTGFTCRWQYSTDGGAGWQDVDASVQGYNATTFYWESLPEHDGYQFRCRFVDDEGYILYSNAVTLAAVKGKMKQQPTDQLIIRGETVTFSVDVEGYEGTTFTYLWQYSENLDGYWFNTNFNYNGYKTDTITFSASMDRGDRWYRCKITDQLGNVVYSDPAWLTVKNIIISRQPESLTSFDGAFVSFSVEAIGKELTYSWQYRTDGNAAWTDAGCKTKTINVNVTQQHNGYQYRCKITDKYDNVDYSEAAVLTLEQPAITVSSQPKDVAILEGGTAVFSVVVSADENVTYQWLHRTPWSDKWYEDNGPGSNTGTLSVYATYNRNGLAYRCRITDENGQYIFTDEAILTVESIPLEISQQPVDAIVLKDYKATFHVEAVGDGVTYQWQFSRNGGSNWSDSSSATQGYNTDTLTVVGTEARNGFLYRCKITDEYGKIRYSNVVKLTVTEQLLQITGQPENASVEEDGEAVFSVEATGIGLTYQWQYQVASGSAWYNSSAATQGYNTDTLTVVGTLARNGFVYRCKITDENGCVLYSDIAALSIKKTFVKITSQPRDSLTKQGGRAAFTVEATGEDLTYYWQYSTNGKAWHRTTSYTTGYNTPSLSVIAEPKRDGFLYRCKITDGDGNVLYSDAAALTVDIPVDTGIEEQPKDGYRMIGQQAQFTVTFRGQIASIQWQYQLAPGSAWYNSSAATQGYNTDTLTVDAQAKRNGFRYRCVITDTEGYIYTSEEALLTVTKAQFDSNPQSVTVKAGEQTVMQVEVRGEYQQLYWQYSRNGGVSWYASSFTGCKTEAMTVGATAARNGFRYRCVLIDADGNVIYSDAAVLTVI